MVKSCGPCRPQQPSRSHIQQQQQQQYIFTSDLQHRPYMRQLTRTAAQVRCIYSNSSSRTVRAAATAAAAARGRVGPRCNCRGTANTATRHAHTLPGSSSSSSSRRTLLFSGAASVCLSTGLSPWGSWSSGAAAAAAAGTGARRHMATPPSAAAGAAAGGGASATGVLVVYVTAPSAEVAGSIAEQLVGVRLAACVNILPGITSVYTWKGKVEKDAEVLMIIKTQAVLLEALTAKVKELHPYDEPEVIGLPVVGGSASYLQWVADSTSQ